METLTENRIATSATSPKPSRCLSPERDSAELLGDVAARAVERIQFARRQEAEIPEHSEIAKRHAAVHAWKTSGAPVRHVNAVEIRNSATGPWRDKFDRLKSKIGEGFLVALLGIRGNGKTQMAVCLMREAAGLGLSTQYCKAMDLFRQFRETFRTDGPSEVLLIRKLVMIEMLVIDEAGERAETEFEARTLTNLIDQRYDRGRDTILISNQTPEAFSASIGPSIVSRMQETGEAIVCNWPSYRAVQQAKGAM